MRKTKLFIPALALLLGSTAMVGCTPKSNTPAQKEVKVEEVVIRNAKTNVYFDDYEEGAARTLQLQAVVNPEGATNKAVSWSSSSQAVASVSETGLVTFNSTGTVTITCTSQADETKKASVTITVKEERFQDYAFIGLTSPTFLDAYKAHTQSLDSVATIQSKGKAGTMNVAQYFDNGEETHKDSYKVGNENAFKLDIKGQVEAKTAGALPEEINNPKLKFSFKKDGQDISADALSQHLTIADNQKSITFKAGVKGNYTIKAEADPTYYSDIESEPLSFDVEVVDGYNVYNAKELSVFHNAGKDLDLNIDFWHDIKQEIGAPEDVKGIVLQSDINITKNDLPAGYFVPDSLVEQYATTYDGDLQDYADAKTTNNDGSTFTTDDIKDLLKGSMYDYVSVYTRNTKPNETFNFECNYFTVDSSSLKQVAAFDRAFQLGGTITSVATQLPGYEYSHNTNGSHAQLFAFNVDNHEATPYNRDASAVTYGCGGTVNIKNGTFIGNGQKDGGDDKYLGGLMTFKVDGTTANFQNVLSSKSFITFMARVRADNAATINPLFATTVNMDRCKNVESYNSLVYVKNSTGEITNSYMAEASGCVFLMDENDGEGSLECTNVFAENFVTGQEAWFKGHSASTFVQMFAGIGLPSGWIGRIAAEAQGKTFVKDGKVNLIALELPNGDPFNNTTKVCSGHVNIDNSAYGGDNYSFNMNKLNINPSTSQPYHAGLYGLETMMESQPMGFLVETSGGFGCLTDATTVADGVLYANYGAITSTDAYTALAKIVNDNINAAGTAMVGPGWPAQDYMAQIFAGLNQTPFLATFSETAVPGVEISPVWSFSNTTYNIANFFEMLCKTEIKKGMAAALKQAMSLDDATATAYANTIVDNGWTEETVAAFNGGTEQIPVGFKQIFQQLAAGTLQSFSQRDYLGAYIKPGANIKYIGAMFGLQ